MKHSLFLLFTILLSSSVSAELTDIETIRSVWDLKSQPCNSSVANMMSRNKDEASIKKSKIISLASQGYTFKVPQFPKVKETVVKLFLNDKSRGVIDSYILLANQDLSAPFAAIVITTLPKDITTVKAAFTTIRKLQMKMIKKARLHDDLKAIVGPHGLSLEMIIKNRRGSHCFPTSDFKFVSTGDKRPTIGISRFSLFGRDLVEFSVIVPVKNGMSDEESVTFARSIMDEFWIRFSRI